MHGLASGEAPLLCATGLYKHLHSPSLAFWRARTARTILRDINLSIQPGERIGLAGVSGAGKTTLLNLLLALKGADAGTITCQGRAVRPASVRALRWYRRQVQYIPQDPASSLDPRMSVRDLIREPLVRLNVVDNHTRRIDEALDRVGLDQTLLRARPAALSGGQAQRVAIARAVALRPRLLLADEPLSGLDLPVRARVMQLFDDMSCLDGTAFLIISHDLSVMPRLCERTLILHDGAIIEDRPTTALFETPKHDHTRALVRAAYQDHAITAMVPAPAAPSLYPVL
ncbi:ABC transporter ATP-binding protein [Kushneria phyllosphaerae]|uniref:Putative ABC transporter ATP-binding protein Rv1281c n=1 Tax=Kushneria phyllosphaerae TaxID=2100822 RepID=A0A2R8CI05_9GAMM|nr:dipeptide/oligopeptide/nickel ABC transporter ATP-binding protein [Kushneria phyllosphaerae]SPJ32384.1 putative ABC transporter ATP-binding protein Rv1281c [Kushneria phyllosphaerae]